MKEQLKKGLNKSKEAAKKAGKWVKDNPWSTGLGVTGAIIAGKQIEKLVKKNKDEDNS